ncbi:urea ABC transporter permease subunit UrtC [Ruixingdingia sedimenti]|uniref:Urea ABC transporter permease subunit UrtC n=1 Tax=Ruixingdingia sedimenti TaxID=3073604 RepID=A0ABU1F7A5_9RHOB|nr:urea ABC transporter permease subunit UrtC [Xinfangfangia sp. LG-4]MDR5652743.1 urea ABC transporter permease subunit UrtC [Xinfangfangia sp. LG-4]
MNRTNKLDYLGHLAFVAVILLGVPAALGFDGFELNTFARYLSLAIVAAALALSWGTAGILNLGQAATFGIGAYIMAMHLKLKASAGNPGGLPDFMGWNNVDSLPWFWTIFHSLPVTLIAGLAVPALVAGVMGIFMFRARITGVFVAIITLAFLVAVQLVFIEEQRFTGGQNGLTGLAPLTLFGWTVDTYSLSFYYLVAGCLIAALVVGMLVVRSKVGLILRAIREDNMRVRYFGYDVARYETFVFCLSAAIAGWAGMLYALVLEFASPTYIGVAFSLAIVIWVAVGGRESLFGAASGAILVNMAEGRLSDMFVESWLLMLGILFILFVLFLPRGLFGLVDATARRLMRSLRGAKPAPRPAARTETAAMPAQEATQ